MIMELSIYIYKEEGLFVCLFVCLFFMQSVPVRARAAKLCMVHPWVQEKVKTGSAGARGGWETPPPHFQKMMQNFSNFFLNVENVLPFLRYLHLAFISSHCHWARATFQYKTFTSDVLSNPIVGALQ